MSEIERFAIWWNAATPSAHGKWVRYYDYMAEVDRLATELAEAQDRCRALELSVEQADEMKAHAEASAAAEEAETDHVTAERDTALAEVERLIAERDAARAEVERMTRMGKDLGKDWLEVAAQVADNVKRRAQTAGGMVVAGLIARRIRAMMEETR